MHLDLLIYPLHAAFWTAFGIADWWANRQAPSPESSPSSPPAAASDATAPYSRSVLAIHFIAFGALYLGLGRTVIPNRVPEWLPGQRILGTLIVAAGSALMAWARIWFTSWRFRAKLDAGHQLATGGPFAWVRNPIYMGMNLLALGSAIWAPDLFTWIGVALMALGSDLRGRAEEHLLRDAFGDAYSAYAQRTARFIPGIY